MIKYNIYIRIFIVYEHTYAAIRMTLMSLHDVAEGGRGSSKTKDP